MKFLPIHPHTTLRRRRFPQPALTPWPYLGHITLHSSTAHTDRPTISRIPVRGHGRVFRKWEICFHSLDLLVLGLRFLDFGLGICENEKGVGRGGGRLGTEVGPRARRREAKTKGRVLGNQLGYTHIDCRRFGISWSGATVSCGFASAVLFASGMGGRVGHLGALWRAFGLGRQRYGCACMT